MNITEFQEKLLQPALQASLTEAELYFERKESFQCMLHKGEIDNYETSDDGSISLRGLYESKMGYAYTEKLGDDSIAFLTKDVEETSSELYFLLHGYVLHPC